MRTSKITRDEALKLLEKYNKEPFSYSTWTDCRRRDALVCKRTWIR